VEIRVFDPHFLTSYDLRGFEKLKIGTLLNELEKRAFDTLWVKKIRNAILKIAFYA
jgi:hypothetical protein